MFCSQYDGQADLKHFLVQSKHRVRVRTEVTSGGYWKYLVPPNNFLDRFLIAFIAYYTSVPYLCCVTFPEEAIFMFLCKNRSFMNVLGNLS